ncbi:MAG: ArnT family glycosyltransferase [Candidatus Hinthialibacter sp.]
MKGESSFDMLRRGAPVVLLLGLHAGILLHSVRNKSASVDELGHLAAGLYSLTNHDFRCNRLSPPLQNIVCALPVMLGGDYRLTYDHICWEKGVWNGLGERFVEANPGTFHRNLMMARGGSVILSVLLCWLIFQWAKEIWGYAPGLLVLAAAIVEPNFIAHGRLCTTDIAPTLFFLLAGRLAWRFVERPNRRRLILVGVAFGLMWCSKHSGLVLLPAFFLAWAILFQFHAQPLLGSKAPFLRSVPARYRAPALSLGLTMFAALAGLLVIWGCYGFEVGDKTQPPRSPKESLLWTKISIPVQTMVYFLGWEDRFRFDHNDVNDPLWRFLRERLPAFSHWEGFCANQNNARRASPTFFLGETKRQRIYAYYPVLFLLKSPLALLILFAIGGIVLASGRAAVDRRMLVIGVVWPAVYALILIGWNRAYIGYRHALPIVPFFLIFGAGAAFRFLWGGEVKKAAISARREMLGRKALALLFSIWLAVDALSVHPHYLAYYNMMAGGPENGHLIAVDSNFDWGQDLLYLKEYLGERGVDDAYLIYFGPKSLPAAYGIPHRTYKTQSSLPAGTYVISASMLRQYISVYYFPELRVFANRQPDGVAAYTQFVYRVESGEGKMK